MGNRLTARFTHVLSKSAEFIHRFLFSHFNWCDPVSWPGLTTGSKPVSDCWVTVCFPSVSLRVFLPLRSGSLRLRVRAAVDTGLRLVGREGQTSRAYKFSSSYPRAFRFKVWLLLAENQRVTFRNGLWIRRRPQLLIHQKSHQRLAARWRGFYC